MATKGNTAIITCMDSNFEDNLLRDFLFTLRGAAGYEDMVIVLDYGMSDEALKAAEKEYNAIIHKCRRDRKILFSLRNRDLAAYIKSLPSHITHVMAIDGGDVWFQAPIMEAFELCSNRLGYIESDVRTDRHKWTLKILGIMDNDIAQRLLESFKGTRLKNAGMICGPKDLVVYIAEGIYAMAEESKKDFFGLDQLFFNYIVNSMEPDVKITLPKKLNYLLIDNKDDFIIKDGMVYDVEGHLISIVHNAGGLGRVLKKDDDRSKDWIYRKVFQT